MKSMILALVLAIPVLAQNPKQEVKLEPKKQPPAVTKFIDVKHLSGDRLNRVYNLIDRLHAGKARFIYDDLLKTYVIQGNTAADVAAVEETMKRFDVPAAESRIRQIQLTVYLLEPSDEEPAATQRAPAELSSAVEQLRTAFGYKHFRLLETTIMQGRENSSFRTFGALNVAAPTPGLVATYEAEYGNANYLEAQNSVLVNKFSYHLRVPSGGQFADSTIRTDLTVKEGQKLVIGKVTKGQNERSGFLVVTARVD